MAAKRSLNSDKNPHQKQIYAIRGSLRPTGDGGSILIKNHVTALVQPSVLTVPVSFHRIDAQLLKVRGH